MRGPRDGGVAIDQRAGVERREEPLVGIDDERIRPVDASEAVTDGRRDERGPTVRPVHVQPDAALPADVGDTGEVVHDARVRRSGARHDREEPVGVGVVERSGQALARQPPALVVRDLDQIDVHHGRRRGDRGVRGVRGRDRPPRRAFRRAGTRHGAVRRPTPTGCRRCRRRRSIRPAVEEVRPDRRATGAPGSRPRRRRPLRASSPRRWTRRSAPGRTGRSPSSGRRGRTRGTRGDPSRSWRAPARPPRCATPVRRRCPRP